METQELRIYFQTITKQLDVLIELYKNVEGDLLGEDVAEEIIETKNVRPKED